MLFALIKNCWNNMNLIFKPKFHKRVKSAQGIPHLACYLGTACLICLLKHWLSCRSCSYFSLVFQGKYQISPLKLPTTVSINTSC
jgi:hypothetical protein